MLSPLHWIFFQCHLSLPQNNLKPNYQNDLGNMFMFLFCFLIVETCSRKCTIKPRVSGIFSSMNFKLSCDYFTLAMNQLFCLLHCLFVGGFEEPCEKVCGRNDQKRQDRARPYRRKFQGK